jgi:DNA processing protein
MTAYPELPSTHGRADERTAWLALASVYGVGELTLSRLVSAFGSAVATLESASRTPEPRWRTVLAGILERRPPAELAAAIREAALDPGRVSRRVAELGGWTLTPFDADFPVRLRGIEPMPPVLFGMGDALILSHPHGVAMVGTRRPTPGGRTLATRIATALADRGASIISGLAFGIDGAAHAATLAAGGRTVAVIGGGLAHAGPRAHGLLLQGIIASGGAVVGEHPPDSIPTRGTFPRRNRIISGLAVATLVIEAPERSGALITARHALEQGRPVFAAPGRPGDAAVAGCLALLRETPARPIVGVAELLEDLELDASGLDAFATRRAAPGRQLDAVSALQMLPPPERAVAEQLLAGPASTDGIVRVTRLSPSVVAGSLTLLQLRGWSQPLGALHLPAGPLLRTARPHTERVAQEPAGLAGTTP